MNYTIQNAGGIFGQVLITFGIVSAVLALIVNLFFAIAVYSDARKIVDSDEELLFVTPGLWCLATLFGSVFVAGMFWVMHHSTLRRRTRRCSACLTPLKEGETDCPRCGREVQGPNESDE